jgi:hypothetical protein
MELHDCDECHRFCKMLSQQKHVVLQSTAPLQLKRFEVGHWVAAVATSPLQPIQKKTLLPNHPIH